MSEQINRPRYSAFTKVERKNKKATWLKIGVAFAIKNDNGLSLKLNALPIDGQIFLFDLNDANRADETDAPF